SGPLAGPLNAAASVIDMARDNRAESQDTPVVDSIKGEDKEPMADPAAGDKPPVDLMSWPEVYRDEETRQALPSSEHGESDQEEQGEGAGVAPDGSSESGAPSESGVPSAPSLAESATLARSEVPAPSLAAQPVADRKAGPAAVQTAEPSVAEPSVAELVSQLAEQTALLARQELALARLEVRETGRRAGLGLGALSLAGVVGLYGGAALVTGVVLLVAIPLAGWSAALIVGGGLSLLAGMVALVGARQVRAAIRPCAASLLATAETDLDKVIGGPMPTKAGS
ncbi:MAG: hypothetical protein DLM54_03595, partial [Acidimicrobiales bacterium]